MRITVVTASLGSGGIARVLSMLATRWLERGWQVRILTWDAPGAQPAFALPAGVEVLATDLARPASSVPDALVANVERLTALRRGLRGQADVIVGMGDQTNVLVLLASRALGTPVVVSERVDFRHHRIGRSWAALRGATYPLADALVVQTSAAFEALPAWLRRRASVIPNPVPAPPCAGGADRRGGGRPVLVAMGRLVAQKGFDVLLDAFARLAGEFPDWSLVIWGEGPERPALESRVRALGLEGRARLPGNTGEPLLRLREAEVFVLSSRYEGFPNVLCEAMSLGVAVVATDCESGPGEIVRDGVDGVLVGVEDPAALARALARLMRDESTRRRMGSAARTVVDRFSMDAVMGRWDELVQSLAVRRR